MTTTMTTTTESMDLTSEGQDQLSLSLSDYEAMELEQCEVTIEEGMIFFVRVGHALHTIRDSRLYRQTHKTFEDYVQERWHKGKSEAYRLINAAQVYQQIEAFSPIGDRAEHLLPANEAQARPLSQLPEEQRVWGWQQAVEAAGGQPTAAQVQAVVDEMLPPKPVKDLSQEAEPATAALFEVEPAVTQSGFVSPGPSEKPEEMSDEEREANAKPTASAADALAALNADRDERVQTWNGEPAEDLEEEPELTSAAPETKAEEKPAGTPAAPAKLAPAPPTPTVKAAAPTPPAAPSLPPGFATAIVKEEDYKKAMERGLWPLASVLETVTELEETIKVLEAGELSKALVEASPSVPLYPPPSMAMVLAGSAATRLAEINNTMTTVLTSTETQLLDELFPERETTGADHIVAVLVTARMRDMSALEAT